MEIDDPNINERIIKEYFNLNPQGMPESTIYEVKQKLKSPNEFIIDGQPFTLTLLAAKYRRYIDWHRKKYGSDEKFVKTADKLNSPNEFCNMNRFYNHYGTPKGSRELYMFGDFQESELRASLNSFLSKFGIINTPLPNTIPNGERKKEEFPTQNFEIGDPDF